jgi:osmotically-inducible protein OsmY
MKHTKGIIVLLLALFVATSCASSVGANIDDAGITTRVKTAFVNDPVIGAARIDVETFKGVVTLSGRVKSKEDEQKAIELARKIRGVVEVKSQLQIGG